MNKKSSIIILSLIILFATFGVGRAFTLNFTKEDILDFLDLFLNKEMEKEAPVSFDNQPLGAFTLVVPQGGTGENEFASSTLVAAHGIDKLTGTSSPTVDSIHATSTTISSEIMGTLLVNNVTVTGTCTGCGGAGTNEDMQDAYNLEASDGANVLLATGKDIIYSLPDVATDPNFILSVAADSESQFRMQRGSSSPLVVLTADGRLGLGTSTPGSGLSVQATSTFFGLDAYIYGQLNLPFIVATSTTASSTLPQLTSTNVNTVGLQADNFRVDGFVCNGASVPEFDADGDLVCGTDDGGASTSDLQDAYNSSADDAMVLAADTKDIIFSLANTATDPNFILSVADGEGQFQIANGSTTLAVFTGYGRLGIGTTSPGTALAVQATSTLLGGDVYIYGQLNVPYLVGTSTATSTLTGGLQADGFYGTGGIRIGDLASCDTIDTDANGVLSCGSDGGGASSDMQDAYDLSGATSANVLLASAKDVIFSLADAATDPNFTLSVASEGQGEFRIAIGSTTNAVWWGDGRLGIATATPGTGFAVQATSTLLGGDVYIYGQTNLPFIVATSTTASSTFPQLTTTSLTATGLTVLGDFTVESVGTSAVPALISTDIAATSLTLSGAIDVGAIGTNSLPFLLSTDIAATSLTLSGTVDVGSIGTNTLPTITATDINTDGLTITGNLNVENIGTNTIPTITSTNIATAGLTVTGEINVESGASSTIASLISTDINTTGLTVGGALRVTTTGTSTFSGGITAATGGLEVTAGGLRVDVGDVVFDQNLEVVGSSGFGSSSPYGYVSVEHGTGKEEYPAFVVADNGTSTPSFIVLNSNGYVGVASSVPWGVLSVEIPAISDEEAVAFAVGDEGTSTPALAVYSSGITKANQLQTGNLIFQTDAGSVSWIDLPITTSAFWGTIESYSAQLDGTNTLSVYGESDGKGSLINERIGISSTTPGATLAITGATTTPSLYIDSDSFSNFIILGNGNVGIGTETPEAIFAISTSGRTIPALLIDASGSGEGNVAISVDGDACVDGSVDTTCSLNDLAELFPADNVEAGDLVSFISGKLIKAIDEKQLVGAIATSPAIVFEGSSIKTMGGIYQVEKGKAPLTLAGKIPVKVTGEIKSGDPITVSSIPGVGMKAIKSGRIIGYAVEDSMIDTVQVLIQNGYWHNPDDSTTFIKFVKTLLSWFKKSIVTFKGIIIGSEEQPSGITLFDKTTKQPYCVVVNNGELENLIGACE